MKILYLVRHGKSGWRHKEKKDIERPLKKKGIEDTERIASHLKEKGILPELFVASPAKRTRQTSEVFAEVMDYPQEMIEYNKSIYGSSREELLTVVLNLDNSYNSVILFGHDPALANLTSFVTRQTFEKIPTAGVVCIKFNIDQWSQISEDSGQLEFSIYPKMFV